MGAPISRKSTIGVPLQILLYYSTFLKQIKILIEFDSAKYTFDFINGRISEIYAVSLWFSEINSALFERAA